MNTLKCIIPAVLFIFLNSAVIRAGIPSTVGEVMRFDNIIRSDERISFNKGIEENISPSSGGLFVKVPVLSLPGRGDIDLNLSHVYNSSGVDTFIDDDVSGGNLGHICSMWNLTGRDSFGGVFYAKYGLIDEWSLVSEGMIMDTAYIVADVVTRVFGGGILGDAVKRILSYFHMEYIDNSTVHVFIPQMQPVVSTSGDLAEPRALISDMMDLIKLEFNESGMPVINIDFQKYILDMSAYLKSGNIYTSGISNMNSNKHPRQYVSIVMNDGSTVSFEWELSSQPGIVLYTPKQPDDNGRYILVYDYGRQQYIFMRGDGKRFYIDPYINPVFYIGGGDLSLEDIYDISKGQLPAFLSKLSTMVQLKGIPYGVVSRIEDAFTNTVAINYSQDSFGTINFGAYRITNIIDSLMRQTGFNYYTEPSRSKWELFSLKSIQFPDGRSNSYYYEGDENREQPARMTIRDPAGRNTVIHYKVTPPNQFVDDNNVLFADVAGAYFYINKIEYPIGGFVEYESSPIDSRLNKHFYNDQDLTAEMITKRREYSSSDPAKWQVNETTFTYNFERSPATLQTGALYFNPGAILDFLATWDTDKLWNVFTGGLYIKNLIEVRGGHTRILYQNGKVEDHYFKKSRLGYYNHWMFSVGMKFSSANLPVAMDFGTLKAGYCPARLLEERSEVSGSRLAAKQEYYRYDSRWNIINKQTIQGANDFSYDYGYDYFGNITNEAGPFGCRISRIFTPQVYNITEANIVSALVNGTVPFMNASDTNVLAYFPSLLFQESNFNNNSWQGTSYSYDGYSDGKILGRLHYTANAVGAVTANTYTRYGEIESVTDPLGHVASNSYDYNYDGGQKIKITTRNTVTSGTISSGGFISPALENVDQTQLFSKAGHWLLEEIDPMGDSTLYNYDILGRVTNIIFPDNTTKSYKYYDIINNIHVDVRDNEQKLSGAFNRYLYDGLGRLTSLQKYLAEGNIYSAATNFYKPWGDLDSVVDFEGRRTALTYDEEGKILEIRCPDGSKLSAGYYYNDNTTNYHVCLADEESKLTTFLYDIRGRLAGVKDAAESNTTYQYDNLSNLTRFIDARGFGVSYEYDKMNRLTKETYQNGTNWRYYYDMNNNLALKIDGRGGRYSNTYDELDRLTNVRYTGPNTEDVSFGYDKTGKSLFWKSVNPARTNYFLYSYDNRDRLTNEVQFLEGGRYSISYTYNTIGNLTSKTYPCGSNQVLLYDRLHRLTNQIFGGASIGFDYNKSGTVSNIIYGNGARQSYRYDLRNRVNEFSITKGSQVLHRESYTYDRTGNRLTFTGMSGYTLGYEYDALDRLTAVLYPEKTGNARYFYDAAGNRTVLIYPYGKHNYTYNNLNELTRMRVNMTGRVDFEYDANGNLKKERRHRVNDLFNETAYHWGVNDRLESIAYTNDKNLYFAYTPSGQRVRKTYQEGANIYTDRLYISGSSGEVLEERNLTGNTIENIYAGNVRFSAEGVEYTHDDTLFSTVLITGADGLVKQKYSYDAFGEIETAKGTSGNHLTYNGKEQDESGLYYYGARYYNSIYGRWISRDPKVGEIYKPDSLNRYNFNYNNPLIYSDLDGQETKKVNLKAKRFYSTETGRFVKSVFESVGENVSFYSGNTENVWSSSVVEEIAKERGLKTITTLLIESQVEIPTKGNTSELKYKKFWRFTSTDLARHVEGKPTAVLGVDIDPKYVWPIDEAPTLKKNPKVQGIYKIDPNYRTTEYIPKENIKIQNKKKK